MSLKIIKDGKTIAVPPEVQAAQTHPEIHDGEIVNDGNDVIERFLENPEDVLAECLVNEKARRDAREG